MRVGKLLALQSLYLVMLYYASGMCGYEFKVTMQTWSYHWESLFYVVAASVLYFLMSIFQPNGILSWLFQTGGNLWILPVTLVALVHMMRNRAVARWFKAVLAVLLFAGMTAFFPFIVPFYLLWQVKEFSRAARITACIASALLALAYVVPPYHFLVFHCFQAVAAVLILLILRDDIRESRRNVSAPTPTTSETALSSVSSESVPTPLQITQEDGVTSDEEKVAVIKLPSEQKQLEPE